MAAERDATPADDLSRQDIINLRLAFRQIKELQAALVKLRAELTAEALERGRLAARVDGVSSGVNALSMRIGALQAKGVR